MDWDKDYVSACLEDMLTGLDDKPIRAPLVPVAFIARIVAENAVLRCMMDVRDEVDAKDEQIEKLGIDLDCERDRANAAEAKVKELQDKLITKTVLADAYMRGECRKPACADKEDEHEHDSV